jgi:uncharacterized protein YbcV (DUF1398 family)
MSKAIENLQAAQKRAMAIRPKVGGFPYLAETLRRAGVTRNIWSLPACQSIFLTTNGPVVMQGEPLVSGMADVPAFDREGLIRALRLDQAGESTFPEFLTASWRAGVIGTMSISKDEPLSTTAAMVRNTWKPTRSSTSDSGFDFLYRNPAFDAFEGFSDFVESIRCETSESCQVRDSDPCRGATTS